MIQSVQRRPLVTSSASTQAPTSHVFAAASRGRSCWSGLLRVSLVALPVKAYSAVSSTANAPHFHLLHAGCGQRIGYHKHCPRHGTVAAEAIVRIHNYLELAWRSR